MHCTELILIRHGEPQMKDCFLGKTDSELSHLGWEQLEQVFANFNNASVLVTSPLKRCLAFAKNIEKNLNLESNLVIKKDLREYDFGDWDGKSFNDIYASAPEKLNNFFSEPENYPPPNAESYLMFTKRVITAVNQLLDSYLGKKVIMLTHGGVIKTILAWCLGLNYQSNIPMQKLKVDYASVSAINVFRSEHGFQFQLSQMNGLHYQVNSGDKVYG